jgi:hypothetical protein
MKTWDEVWLMRTLMLVIVVVMIASILSILVIKPFSHSTGGKDTQPQKAIQQPDPQKQ